MALTILQEIFLLAIGYLGGLAIRAMWEKFKKDKEKEQLLSLVQKPEDKYGGTRI